MNQIPPIYEHFKYMFEQNSSNPVGRWTDTDDAFPYDKTRAVVSYPTWYDIFQFQDILLQLRVAVVTTMGAELVHPKKNTVCYLTAIWEGENMVKVSKEVRAVGLGVDARNSVSELVHAASTYKWYLELYAPNIKDQTKKRWLL